MDMYMGTIVPFAFKFAPQYWDMCAGQELLISQFAGLYSLLGVTYGGNAHTTFKLPDLRGRLPLGMGQGPGQPQYQPGQTGGGTVTALDAQHMPSHSHGAQATTTVNVAGKASAPSTTPSSRHNYLGQSGGGPGAADIWSAELGDSPVAMGGTSTAVDVDNSGDGAPFSVMNPFLALNFCILIQGEYPPHP